jgi:cytochrome P450
MTLYKTRGNHMSDQLFDTLSLANLLRPEVRIDPYTLYREIRSQDPVYWDEENDFWVLTRYADITSVLRDGRFSKAQGMTLGLDRLPKEERGEAEPVFGVFEKQMLYADPPYHTKLRGLVNKAFTPRTIRSMESHIQNLVDDFLDAVQESGRMDVISDLAFPLPATVIMEMLGLPIEDRAQFKKWSDDLFATLGVVRHTPELFEHAHESVDEMTKYICDIRGKLGSNPKDDLLSALATAVDQEHRLSDDELVANTILLLGAGHETTTNLIGNGLLALMRNPEQMQALKEDPSLIANAVEEFMRYDNPVQIVWRVATEDIEVGDKIIGNGEFINLVVGAANRDPEQFPDPDRLDLRRNTHGHVGFGLGVHFCLGAPLARLEGQIAIGTVLRRMPDLQLESEDLEWQKSPTFRGVLSLPVAF